MTETHDDAPQDPSIVTDEAAGAGTEKPAVASDEAKPDASERAPTPFEIEDAVSSTAIEGVDGDEA